jgi:hypothetical protein
LIFSISSGGEEFLGDGACSQSSGISTGLLAVIGEYTLEDLVEHLIEAVEQPSSFTKVARER